MDSVDDHGDEAILLEETGQRVSLVQAYLHRGAVLRDLCLYDYMSIVKLRRKAENMADWGQVALDSAWPLGQVWVQTLRKPGKHASVCLDGYFSMDFAEGEEQSCHRRYVALSDSILGPSWRA